MVRTKRYLFHAAFIWGVVVACVDVITADACVSSQSSLTTSSVIEEKVTCDTTAALSQLPKQDKSWKDELAQGICCTGHFLLHPIEAYQQLQCIFSDNFAIVISDKICRAAQPTPEKIIEYQQKYGIKSIINLRAKEEDAIAFDREQQCAADGKIAFYNIPMSVSERTPDLIIKELFSTYQLIELANQLPVLIHCRAGSDRTGEACGLLLIEFFGKSKEEALMQLSSEFGHLYMLYPEKRKRVMDWKKGNLNV